MAISVDSAGTGAWHVGNPPDPRSQAVARAHGIDISGYRARQVTAADYRRFTDILALDRDNLAELRRRAPSDATARIGLLMDAAPGRKGQAVADRCCSWSSGLTRIVLRGVNEPLAR